MRWIALSAAFCGAFTGATVLWVHAIRTTSHDRLPPAIAGATPATGGAGGAVVVVPSALAPPSRNAPTPSLFPVGPGIVGPVTPAGGITAVVPSPGAATTSPAAPVGPGPSPVTPTPTPTPILPTPIPIPIPKLPAPGPVIVSPPATPQQPVSAPVVSPSIPGSKPTGLPTVVPAQTPPPPTPLPVCPDTPVTGVTLSFTSTVVTAVFRVAAGCSNLQVTLGTLPLGAVDTGAVVAKALDRFDAGGPYRLTVTLPPCPVRAVLESGSSEVAQADGGSSCAPAASAPAQTSSASPTAATVAAAATQQATTLKALTIRDHLPPRPRPVPPIPQAKPEPPQPLAAPPSDQPDVEPPEPTTTPPTPPTVQTPVLPQTPSPVVPQLPSIPTPPVPTVAEPGQLPSPAAADQITSSVLAGLHP